MQPTTLMLSYFHPPDAPGVRRLVSLLRYLPENDIYPMVLACRSGRGAGHDPSVIHEDWFRRIKVVRTESLDPYRSLARWGRTENSSHQSATSQLSKQHSELRTSLSTLRRHAFIPDDRCGWIPFAVWQGFQLVRRHPSIRVIYSSNYPQSAHVAAGLIARATGRKWLADFRDGWTQNPAFHDPGNAVMAAMQQGLERWTARRADAIVTVSAPITRHLQSLRPRNRQPVVTITNGFDDELLVSADAPAPEPLRPGKFTVLYTGTLFGRRTAEPFLAAVARLLADQPLWRERLAVVFRTQPTAELLSLRNAHQLESIVEFLQPVPFQQIIAEQRRADALLLILEDGPGAEIMVSQKVFEYLAARRPILAMIPPNGAAAGILAQTAGSLLLPTRDPGAASEALGRFLQNPATVSPARHLDQYRRSAQAAAMAALIHRLAGELVR